MAEFEPVNSPDAAEAAYREELLADDAGRDARRARLLAALPRPASAATPVSPSELAWRWQPYALAAALGAGLLVVAVFALRSTPPAPSPLADRRLAAAPAASASARMEPAPVVAQASPPPVAARGRSDVKVRANNPLATEQPPLVVADAGIASQREVAVPPLAAAEAAKPAAPEPPRVAAPIPPRAMSEQQAFEAASLARSRRTLGVAAAPPGSLAASLAASDPRPTGAADALLASAVQRRDAAAVRAALLQGASVHHRDAAGRTALMLAAQGGAREIVDLLLAAGARKNDRDSGGLTAADHAEASGHIELADHLR
ncbi:MAG: ankyrin repeat domain-containing protein [Rubrivivax sp.]|nr:MAG: ankyrin repeat domain-containing protein [Rubrivivax sp.]